MHRTEFKEMWQNMQKAGYFKNHTLYADWHSDYDDVTTFNPDSVSLKAEPEALFLDIDFSKDEIVFPVDYSAELEIAVKRNEYYWLPKMFDIPQTGAVVDLGCGYGRSIEWLHKIFDITIGVDISEHIISIARKRFKTINNVFFYTNNVDSFPREIETESIDFIYCFTVFQHIPREYTLNFLIDSHRIMKPDAKIVFNLLTGINEDVNDGEVNTEWVIGYTRDQVNNLIQKSNLQINKIKRWKPKNPFLADWLWIEAIKSV